MELEYHLLESFSTRKFENFTNPLHFRKDGDFCDLSFHSCRLPLGKYVKETDLPDSPMLLFAVIFNIIRIVVYREFS